MGQSRVRVGRRAGGESLPLLYLFHKRVHLRIFLIFSDLTLEFEDMGDRMS